MLAELLRYADEHGTGTHPGCVKQKIDWRIDIDGNGQPVGPVTEMVDDNGKQGRFVEIPAVKRQGITPRPFPVDKADYTLAFPPGGDKVHDALKRHQGWLDLIADAEQATGLAALGALRQFGQSISDAAGAWPWPGTPLPAKLTASQFVLVYVDGAAPGIDPAVKRWWAQTISDGANGKATPGQCSVCGRANMPIPDSHQVGIRGLTSIGGQAQAALVSVNLDCFEHHGLDKASPGVCVACGERSHQMLNTLLADERHARRMGGGNLFVWWASADQPANWFEAIEAGLEMTDSANPDAIRKAILAAEHGSSADVPVGRFEAVVIAANNARVVIRDLYDMPLAVLVDNLTHWVLDTAALRKDDLAVSSPALWLMTKALLPPGEKQKRADANSVCRTLWRSAITGDPIPDRLGHNAIRRVRAANGVSFPLAAVLGCWLTRKDPMSDTLLPERLAGKPAYEAGRLFAILASAGKQATGTDLIARSYGQASLYPSQTITRMLRLHQMHLSKLRRSKRVEAANGINKRVGAVMARIGEELPKQLDIHGQAEFALGMYHQQVEDRQRQTAAKAAADATGTEQTDDNTEEDQ